MFRNLTLWAFSSLDKIMGWADPGWWIWLSFLLFIIGCVHPLPLELDKDSRSFLDLVLVWVRRVCLLLLLGFGFVIPLVMYVAFGAMAQGNDVQTSSLFIEWFLEMASAYWMLPISTCILGITSNFMWHRYGEPYFSNMSRDLRVNQHEEEVSDARDEIKKFEARSFVPEDYFLDGFYFLGMDEDNLPIYVTDKLFHETNSAFIAPTRFGKGVELGVILKQSVLKGNCVFMVDPKGDENMPYILEAVAREVGRPYIHLDLRPVGKGNWHPFKGGSLRDRRSRVLSTFGLEPGGTNADVYKSKERSILDKVLKICEEGTIREMLPAVEKLISGAKDDLSELRDGLLEWSQISTFMGNRKRKGHSIEESLMNNAIVYVRGSLDDGVIKRATRTYIQELIQELIRLNLDRTTHVTVCCDEVRFVISKELVNALATAAGFKANLLLATQAISDLQNLDDQTIDGKALAKSFEVNCQIKNIYKAGDADTAEWGELISGTKFIRVASNEKTEVNHWGGEKWDNTRAFSKVEVPIIHRNVLLSLPPMVSVLYMPGSLPRVMYTSWIAVDKSITPWDKKSSESKDIDNSDDELEIVVDVVLPAESLPAVVKPAKPKMRANPNAVLKSTPIPLPVHQVELKEHSEVHKDE